MWVHIACMLFDVSCCMLYYVLCMVHDCVCIVYCLRCMLVGVMIYGIWFIAYVVCVMMCRAWCIVYVMLCIVHYVWFDCMVYVVCDMPMYYADGVHLVLRMCASCNVAWRAHYGLCGLSVVWCVCRAMHVCG